MIDERGYDVRPLLIVVGPVIVGTCMGSEPTDLHEGEWECLAVFHPYGTMSGSDKDEYFLSCDRTDGHDGKHYFIMGLEWEPVA